MLQPVGGEGLADRAPPRAAAQVSHQGALDVGLPPGPQGGQAHDDAGGAEPALAGAGGAEGLGPGPPLVVCQPPDGDDRATRDPAGGRDAGDAGSAVDEHGAAAALPLGAAAVLGGADSEPVAQHLEKGSAVVDDLDGTAVEGEGQRQVS